MKTLTEHTLIYDEECPLCQAYTSAFIKTGMLDSKGRASYATMAGKEIQGIDWDRARNEIALINKKDQSISYGNDSLLQIIGYNWPFVQWIFKFKLFRFLLDQLYFFISFNRKVIAPGRIFEGKNCCTPDLNFPYRWAYIIFAWIITSLTMARLSSLIIDLPAVNLTRGVLITGGLLVFQGAFVSGSSKKRMIHYFGNLMTLCLIGSFLSFPIILLSQYIPYNPFFTGYLLIVALIILAEHFRRARILELPWFISATIVLYPLIILFIILPQS